MNIAVILMSGSGNRLNESTPKQYLKINNKYLFLYPLETFLNNKDIDKIILVVHKEYINFVSDIIKDNKIKIIEGGDTRIESTQNALNYLMDNNVKGDDIILIHDAARPLVSENLISNLIKECKIKNAVTPVLKTKDTLVNVFDNEVSGYLNREIIYSNQTPQTFKFSLIYNAHMAMDKNKSYSDDTSIALDYGIKIFTIPGEETNFKVTTKEDLELLKAYLK